MVLLKYLFFPEAINNQICSVWCWIKNHYIYFTNSKTNTRGSVMTSIRPHTVCSVYLFKRTAVVVQQWLYSRFVHQVCTAVFVHQVCTAVFVQQVCTAVFVQQVCTAGFVQQGLYTRFVHQVCTAGFVQQGLYSRVCTPGLYTRFPDHSIRPFCTSFLNLNFKTTNSHCTVYVDYTTITK